MSIPGLGQAGASGKPATGIGAGVSLIGETVTIHNLAPQSEWRFEVAIGHAISVRLLNGTAELFGTELALQRPYTFRTSKSAIYTWHGCRLEVTGSCAEYTAEETPMVSYANTHFALENLRDNAENNGGDGPRVLVIGPSHSGKTSLVKILTSYAVKMGRQPMVVNTDSSEGLLSISGTVTAVPFSTSLDVEEEWGITPTNGVGGVSHIPFKNPLSYYYGSSSPEDNTKLYKPIVSRLALASIGRMAENPEIASAGMIIDTPGSISQGKDNLDLVAHIVSEFSVSVILILGSERLQVDMKKRFESHKTSRGEDITLVKLDKSGGCIDRDDEFMKYMQGAAMREYFFGDDKRILSPHTQIVNFEELTVYKIRGAATTSTYQPGGAKEEAAGSLYELTTPSALMQHCVLAVLHASAKDSQETIRDAPVMGWVYVAEVKEGRLHMLGPRKHERIVDRPMVWGSWPEATVGLLN